MKRYGGVLAVLFMFFVVLGFALAPQPVSAESVGTVAQAAAGQNYTNILDGLKYEKSIHILAMLLIGFGFLMVFVRKHGFGSVTATFLVVSSALPLYMWLRSFGADNFQIPMVSIDSFILAEFAAASLLIAIGAPLGRMKMHQYVMMAGLFIPAYILNEWLLLNSGLFKGFLDTGGSVVIHAFGAYFGLGVVSGTLKLFANKPGIENDKNSNQYCLIGSMMLWIFWPSFTSALVSPEQTALTAINTVFALCGATLSTFLISTKMRGKIEIEDIANAALAGGVAIGSACNMASPGLAIAIGLVAGALSTFGYVVISPRLEKFIKGTDTCGINNLHGMPGILGGLAGILITGQAGVQILGIVVTVVIAFVLGKISGVIIRYTGEKQVPYSDEDEFAIEHEGPVITAVQGKTS